MSSDVGIRVFLSVCKKQNQFKFRAYPHNIFIIKKIEKNFSTHGIFFDSENSLHVV